MNDPVVYSLTLPVSSINVHLSGSGDASTSGFIYSPTGGFFVSGFVSGYVPSGYIDWHYDFILMSESEIFKIQTYDDLGDFSEEVELVIAYKMPPPTIINPGTPKILTDDTATSGGTSEKFETLSGNFLGDGVVPEDVVLSVNGLNQNEIKNVLFVENTYIETDSFSNSWEIGDKIKIYDKKERPEYTSNILKIDFAGTCSPESLKVFYSNNDFQDVVLYSLKSTSSFDISPTNNVLHITVDNFEKTIVLTTGLSISVLDIIYEINSYFPDKVVYEDNLIMYFKGKYVKIFNSSANENLGFEEGEYYFSLETFFSEPIRYTEEIENFVDILVDGKTASFIFQLETDYTRKEIVDKINTIATKRIAFETPSGMVLLGSYKIQINTVVSQLNLDKFVVSSANYSYGISGWNFSFDVLENISTIKISSLNPFYKLTDISELVVNYKIYSPILSTKNLIVETDFIDLSGTYSLDGTEVEVNGDPAFSKGGGWAYTLQNLSGGENNVSLITLDKFGGQSDPLDIVVTYNDPNGGDYPEPPAGGLKWKSLTNPTLTPDEVNSIMNTIDAIFGPVISGLAAVSSLLSIVKAFIKDFALGWLTALRIAIQYFINEVTKLINDIINCEGIYILSTLPKPSDFKDPNQSILSFFEGGFDGFISKVVASFFDSQDSHRPQITSNETIGGFIIAVDSGSGINNFLNAINSLVKFVDKKILNFGLSAPQNLQAVGQNRRNVITWQSPEGLRPGAYEIYRSKTSGGKPKTQTTKSNSNRKGETPYTTDLVVSNETGETLTTYDLIGTLNDYQIFKEFKFIDGKKTPYEKQTDSTVEKVLNGATSILNAMTEAVLVVSGSTEKDLVNGQTYYYKVVPTFIGTNMKGESHEVVATPSMPELELITENLSSEINGKDYQYKVSKSIYDKDTGLIASTPKDMVVTADGAKITPPTSTSNVYEQGIFWLSSMPKKSLIVKYWAKKEQDTTRATLLGTESGGIFGPFVFVKDDNVLEIQVGKGANITNVIGLPSISLKQTVTFARSFVKSQGGFGKTSGKTFFKPNINFKTPEYYDYIEIYAEEVASLIRSQTGGLKVYVDSKNRIKLEEDQNPNIYEGSYLKILKGNKTLGFSDTKGSEKITEGYSNYESIAGSLSGTPPDWYSIRLGDLFPILNDMLRYIENVMKGFLSGLESATNSLTDFIDLLQTKIDALSEIAKEVQDLVKQAAEILNLKGGFYTLTIPAKKGGNDYFIEALSSATNAPHNTDYAGGIVFLYSNAKTARALTWFMQKIT